MNRGCDLESRSRVGQETVGSGWSAALGPAPLRNPGLIEDFTAPDADEDVVVAWREILVQLDDWRLRLTLVCRALGDLLDLGAGPAVLDLLILGLGDGPRGGGLSQRGRSAQPVETESDDCGEDGQESGSTKHRVTGLEARLCQCKWVEGVNYRSAERAQLRVPRLNVPSTEAKRTQLAAQNC